MRMGLSMFAQWSHQRSKELKPQKLRQEKQLDVIEAKKVMLLRKDSNPL